MPNKTKKIKQFLKEYFIFSTIERRGITWLLTLLILLISFPYLYGIFATQKRVELSITDLKAFDSIDHDSNQSFSKNEIRKSFLFNPNTASDEEFGELGFTEKNILTIRHYLSKGGVFRKPDDIKKIPGTDSELMNSLIPFVQLNSTKSFADSSKYNKKKITNKIVEMNTADSSELVSLYRIGPKTAARIIEYRNQLGGFLTLEQLTEIWGFDEDVLFDLKGKITVDPTKATIFDLNKVEAEELKTHPYFKYKMTNAIVNYRIQHGRYNKMDDLKKIIIMNDSIYKRITMYLKIN